MPPHLSSTRTRFYPRPHLASIFPLQEIQWTLPSRIPKLIKTSYSLIHGLDSDLPCMQELRKSSGFEYQVHSLS